MQDTLFPAPEPAATAVLEADSSPLLDPEKLDVYRVAVEFQMLAARLLPRRGQAVLICSGLIVLQGVMFLLGTWRRAGSTQRYSGVALAVIAAAIRLVALHKWDDALRLHGGL